jgi:hypothetical protein
MGQEARAPWRCSFSTHCAAHNRPRRRIGAGQSSEDLVPGTQRVMESFGELDEVEQRSLWVALAATQPAPCRPDDAPPQAAAPHGGSPRSHVRQADLSGSDDVDGAVDSDAVRGVDV